jgi:hypothetical protein
MTGDPHCICAACKLSGGALGHLVEALSNVDLAI